MLSQRTVGEKRKRQKIRGNRYGSGNRYGIWKREIYGVRLGKVR